MHTRTNYGHWREIVPVLASTLLGAARLRADVGVDLIVNGDFETAGGSFSGWTHQNQAGGLGNWFIQSGTLDPRGMVTIPAPPGPTHAAMADQDGPGSHVLYQDVLIPPTVASASLQFSRYINNGTFHNGPFASPTTLDYLAAANQQCRVDILTTAADPFSTGVLLNVFQTTPLDPLISGYTVQSANLSSLFAAHPGETLRLRFAEADNQGLLLFGIDQVSLLVTVPEPSGLSLLCIFAALAFSSRHRSRPEAQPCLGPEKA